MSKTIIGALLQFFVSIGIISTAEMETVSSGIMAVISLATLAWTVYGRIVAQGPIEFDE